jgi:hypothetical protein
LNFCISIILVESAHLLFDKLNLCLQWRIFPNYTIPQDFSKIILKSFYWQNHIGKEALMKMIELLQKIRYKIGDFWKREVNGYLSRDFLHISFSRGNTENSENTMKGLGNLETTTTIVPIQTLKFYWIKINFKNHHLIPIFFNFISVLLNWSSFHENVSYKEFWCFLRHLGMHWKLLIITLSWRKMFDNIYLKWFSLN